MHKLLIILLFNHAYFNKNIFTKDEVVVQKMKLIVNTSLLQIYMTIKLSVLSDIQLWYSLV